MYLILKSIIHCITISNEKKTVKNELVSLEEKKRKVSTTCRLTILPHCEGSQTNSVRKESWDEKRSQGV